MDRTAFKLTFATLAIVALCVSAWLFRDHFLSQPEPEQRVEETVAAEPEVTEPDGPKHPLPAARASEEDVQRDLVPLPALDDSDAWFLLEIRNTLHPAFEALLVREAVIDRLVAAVDNLPRRKIAETIRPVDRLPDAFGTDVDDKDNIVLGPSSYLRYDAIVAQIYFVDLDTLYDMYLRFYPLLQQAYERLGYPDAYFNDRLVEVIDHLIETPVPAEPIVLVRPNVLYEFADPALEALSSGQKLMLRMGPDNAATMKRVLQRFRAKLTGENTGE